MRAEFLPASGIAVLVGTALARYETGAADWGAAGLLLAAVLLIHAGGNTANDYFDHRSGNDAANTRFVRPFTGGSRMIQRGLLAPREVL
ncbi:MAG: hypothetical protein JW951_00550, partial [Lentisphaerae bacterium]|nr:hypothetical protein [Lentisphaerota bacterium]